MRFRPARVERRPVVNASGCSGARGFSMIELLVVISISLVLAAIAAPNIIDTIANVKLRNSASSVAALLQQARLQAVKDGTYYTTRTGTIGSVQRIYIDTTPLPATATDGSGNSSFDTGEPVTQLTGTTQFATSGAPTFPSSLLGGSGTTPTVTTKVSFNSRGLPCAVSGSVCNAVTQPFLFYMTDLRPQFGWAAVTVSPAGRVKTWYYNGSTWE